MGVLILGATALFGNAVFTAMVLLMLVSCIWTPRRALPLLFMSGPLKLTAVGTILPIDITLLLMAAVVLIFLYLVVFNKIKTTPYKFSILVLIVVLSVIVVFSLWWTIAPWGYISKSGINILFIYLPLVFILVLGLHDNSPLFSPPVFIDTVVPVAVSWVGMGLYNQIHDLHPKQFNNPNDIVHHMSGFGEDYHFFTIFCIFAFLQYFIWILCEKQSLQSLAAGFLLFVLAYGMLNSPARVLTIGLLFVVAITLYKFPKKLSGLAIASIVLITAVALTGVTWYLSNLTATQMGSLQRVTNFDFSGESVFSRFVAVKVALRTYTQDIWHILFGVGVDGVAAANQDSGLYAHNLLLELLLEYGLLLCLPFVLLFVLSVKRGWACFLEAIQYKQAAWIWLTGLYMIFFIFSLSSNTLGNMRFYWILVGISFSMPSFSQFFISSELKTAK